MRLSLLSRLLWALATLVGVSILTFLLTQLMPGDPADMWLRSRGIPVDSTSAEEVKKALGLNHSVFEQYVIWLRNILQFNMGNSFQSGLPVVGELAQRLPATLRLLGIAFGLAILLSVPAGILSALRKGDVTDHLVRIFSIMLSALPQFWIGIMLLLMFAVQLHVFPLMGNESPAHYVLPALTAAVGVAPSYARILRGSMLETMEGLPYKAARARGIRGRQLILFHTVIPSLLPFVTIVFGSIGYLWGAAFIVESIFAWPGIGSYVLSSIYNRDYPVIQAFTLFLAVMVVVINIFVDFLYGVLDPRIREDKHDYRI